MLYPTYLRMATLNDVLAVELEHEVIYRVRIIDFD